MCVPASLRFSEQDRTLVDEWFGVNCWMNWKFNEFYDGELVVMNFHKMIQILTGYMFTFCSASASSVCQTSPALIASRNKKRRGINKNILINFEKIIS